MQRGSELMRVVDPGGPWQLELHMPENRVGNIIAANEKLYDKARENLTAC